MQINLNIALGTMYFQIEFIGYQHIPFKFLNAAVSPQLTTIKKHTN